MLFFFFFFAKCKFQQLASPGAQAHLFSPPHVEKERPETTNHQATRAGGDEGGRKARGDESPGEWNESGLGLSF